MADLVAEDRRQLIVVADQGQQTRGHADLAGGQNEGVGTVADEEGVFPAAVGQTRGLDDPVADLADSIAGGAVRLTGGGAAAGTGTFDFSIYT